MTRVLLVDDEPKVRTLLRTMLEGAGYEVAEAADGAEALRSFRGQRTDVVLCDLFMPERTAPRPGAIANLAVTGNR
jgi:CheY-like chemotaxis protein